MKAASNEMTVRGDRDVHPVRQPNPDAEDGGEALSLRRAAPGDGLRPRVHADHWPTGQVIAKMEHSAEGVLVSDIDLGLIPVAKYFMDPAGHYSTPGNMQLFVDASRQKPVFILGEEEPEGLPYEDIQFEVQ